MAKRKLYTAHKAGRAESLSDITSAAVECRSFRHAFVSLGDVDILYGPRRKIIQFTRHARCVVCKTELIAVYEVPSMRRVKGKYFYPNDYLLQHRATMAEAKEEYLARLRKGPVG